MYEKTIKISIVILYILQDKIENKSTKNDRSSHE